MEWPQGRGRRGNEEREGRWSEAKEISRLETQGETCEAGAKEDISITERNYHAHMLSVQCELACACPPLGGEQRKACFPPTAHDDLRPQATRRHDPSLTPRAYAQGPEPCTCNDILLLCTWLQTWELALESMVGKARGGGVWLSPRSSYSSPACILTGRLGSDAIYHAGLKKEGKSKEQKQI